MGQEQVSVETNCIFGFSSPMTFNSQPCKTPELKSVRAQAAFCCGSSPGGLSFGLPCPRKFHQSGKTGAPRLGGTAGRFILWPEVLQFLVEQL